MANSSQEGVVVAVGGGGLLGRRSILDAEDDGEVNDLDLPLALILSDVRGKSKARARWCSVVGMPGWLCLRYGMTGGGPRRPARVVGGVRNAPARLGLGWGRGSTVRVGWWWEERLPG